MHLELVIRLNSKHLKSGNYNLENQEIEIEAQDN